MCVIIAKKLSLKASQTANNKPRESWFLFKIRDRSYAPEYSLDIETFGKDEVLFLIDKDTRWTEGVNSNGLMMVSAALDNHTDLEDNGSSTRGAGQKEKLDALRKGMTAKNIDSGVKALTDNRFIGTTFVSDGVRMIIVEIYVKNESYERELAKYKKDDLEKLNAQQQNVKIMKGISDDDYDVEVQEIKKDDLVIRTNHGKLIDDAGYQPDDEEKDGWESSTKRYEYTKQAIEALKDAHPFDILTTLKNLKDVDKNPQNNPIRTQTKEKPYYTQTIVMLTPTGSLYVIPIDATFDKSHFNLKDDRKVDFILLPKNLPLFENLITEQSDAKYDFKKFRALKAEETLKTYKF